MPTDEGRRLEEVEAALKVAVELIESINQCHGCLDNAPEFNREKFAKIKALAEADS